MNKLCSTAGQRITVTKVEHGRIVFVIVDIIVSMNIMTNVIIIIIIIIIIVIIVIIKSESTLQLMPIKHRCNTHFFTCSLFFSEPNAIQQFNLSTRFRQHGVASSKRLQPGIPTAL